jgi:hypothetical protein
MIVRSSALRFEDLINNNCTLSTCYLDSLPERAFAVEDILMIVHGDNFDVKGKVRIMEKTLK